jgi:predicted RNA binding protein YcfA (HicA-like mRNA interferase family)
MSCKKELHQLLKKAEKQGWRVNRTKGDHYKWVSPEGQIVFSAQTPSDSRAIKNIIRDLAKKGYEPKGMR